MYIHVNLLNRIKSLCEYVSTEQLYHSKPDVASQNCSIPMSLILLYVFVVVFLYKLASPSLLEIIGKM